MFVRWHKLALTELDEILDQAKERDPQEATNIEKAVERSLNALVTFPKTGRYLRGRGLYEKYVPRTRIKFIYELTPEHIRIVATFHTSRDPKTKPFERRFDEL